MIEEIKKLKTLYDSKYKDFPISKKWHYAERMYRTTGDTKYTDAIRSYITDKFSDYQQYIDAIDDQDMQVKLGNKFIDKIAASRTNPRTLARIPEYRKNPRTKYFQELAWYTNKFTEYNIFEKLKVVKLENIHQSILEFDLASKLMEEKLIKLDPVQTLNSIFHLKHLNIIDKVSEFVIKVEEVYRNIDMKADNNFQNMLYFYTHVIIADTKYYQQFINHTGYDYIFEIFERNINLIFATENFDIICEIGVCFLLRGKHSSYVERAREFLFDTLKESKKFIAKKDSVINVNEIYKIEHQNVLAIMLFMIGDILFPGPNLNDSNLT